MPPSVVTDLIISFSNAAALAKDKTNIVAESQKVNLHIEQDNNVGPRFLEGLFET